MGNGIKSGYCCGEPSALVLLLPQSYILLTFDCAAELVCLQQIMAPALPKSMSTGSKCASTMTAAAAGITMIYLARMAAIQLSPLRLSAAPMAIVRAAQTRAHVMAMAFAWATTSKAGIAAMSNL